MTQFERRDFIQGVGILAGAATAAALAEHPAYAQATTSGARMSYEPKPLSFDPKVIKGISEKVLVSHWRPRADRGHCHMARADR